MNEVRDDHVFWLQEAGIRVQGLKFLHGGICIGLWDTTTPFTISKYVFASKRGQRERGREAHLLNLTDFTKIIPILEDLLFAIRYSEFTII